MNLVKALFAAAAITLSLGTNASLIVEYKFDGDALDSSGNGQHATVNGATLTTDRFGNLDSAYLFDGNDRITSTSNFTDVWTTWTVDLWVNLNSTGRFMTFVEREQVGSFQDLEIGVTSTGKLWMETDNSVPDNNLIGASDLIVGQWHNISVTYDGSFKRMYIDGVLDAMEADNNAFVNLNAPLRIGYHSNASSRQYLDGTLDDIRIYNSVEVPVGVSGPWSLVLLLSGLMVLIQVRPVKGKNDLG